MSQKFIIAGTKSKPPGRTADVINVAARYFVYKLFSATDGRPLAWHSLQGIEEAPKTVARATELGWVVVRLDDGGKGKRKSAALTDEGRRLARKGLRG